MSNNTFIAQDILNEGVILLCKALRREYMFGVENVTQNINNDKTVSNKAVPNEYSTFSTTEIAFEKFDNYDIEYEPNLEDNNNEFLEKSQKQPVNDGNSIMVLLNGKWITVENGESNSVLFVDMLNYIDIVTQNSQGRIVLKLNDIEASYVDTIKNGDKVEIMWKNT